MSYLSSLKKKSYLFYNYALAEIEVRDDIKLESDKKLEKLESFLGRLNNKGE